MSVFGSPYIIHDNSMVLCLDARNSKSYPGSGTTWYDLSRKGDAAMVNTPVYYPTFPSAFDFSGGNGTYFLLTANTPFKTLSGDVTLAGWCRQDNRHIGSTPHQGLICTDITYLKGFKLMSDRWGEVNAMLGNSAGDDQFILTGPSITGLGWKHLCATRNSSTGLVCLYIDGVLVNSGTSYTGSTSTSQVAAVGTDYHSAGYFYHGRISMVSAYNRVLSADEIFNNYSATKNNFNQNYYIINTDLRLFFDAGSQSSYTGTGTAWTNLGTLSNNSTLTNGPVFSADGGGSIIFDGTNDSAVLDSSINFGPNTNWTVNILAKASGFNSDFGNLFSNNSGGPVSNAMGIATNGKMVYNYYDGAWNSKFGNTTLVTDTWYYLTWVNRSSDTTTTMYLNGVVDSPPHNTDAAWSHPINSIGRNWFSSFNGKIASLSYYDVAHTPQQIAENFRWAKSRAYMV